MKKLIFLRFLGFTLINLFVSASYAQSKNYIHLASTNSYSDAGDFSPYHFPDVSPATEGLYISPKAQKAFGQLFQNSEFVNWSAAGKNYLVTFSLDNKKNRVLLDKNGVIIYSISYGTEKDLPFDIRKMVKSVYYDYSINMITQVKQNKRAIWLILLEDSNKFLTLRIENDEMEEVKQLDKVK